MSRLSAGTIMGSRITSDLYEQELKMHSSPVNRLTINAPTSMSHGGWRLLLPFWIDAYKRPAVKPIVDREPLVIWYRKHPKGGCDD